jgi:DNA polymerase elongation subunit (family B)
VIAYFLDTLFERLLFKNIDDLSKITRLRKSFEEMKFGFKKNSRFEKLRNITAGRLVLDIEESMQEFVNEVDYDLHTLAKKYFKIEVPIDGDSDAFRNKDDSILNQNLGLFNLVDQDTEEAEANPNPQAKIDPIFFKKLMDTAVSYLDPVFNQNLVALLLEDKFKFLELTK